MIDGHGGIATVVPPSDLARAVTTVGASGIEIEAGAAARFLLDDPGTVWTVEGGRLDVYAVELRDGQPAGPRRFLWSAEAPAAVFGLATAPIDRPFGLLAVGSSGTHVQRTSCAALQTLDAPPAVTAAGIALVEAFIRDTSAAIGRTFDPRLEHHLTVGQAATVAPGADAGSRLGVVWVQHADGSSLFAGTDGACVSPEDGSIPMAEGLWVTAGITGAQLLVVDTAAAVAQGALWSGFNRYRALFAEWTARHCIAVGDAERRRLERKSVADLRLRERGMAGLADILGTGRARAASETGVDDPLFAACRVVGTSAGIEFRPAPRWEVDRKVRDPLASICRASRVRSRRVALRGRWWRSDHGPLLAWLGEDKRPVALLPLGSRRYELFDAGDGRRVTVDAALAATLDPFAVEFYRPAPDTPIRLKDLGRMVLREMRGDLAQLLLAALASGVIGLALPIATGKMFSDIIPMAVPANIVPLLAALVGLTFGTALFDLTRAFALIRIEGRMNSSLQATIVDRLLALPVPFYRQYAVGDLAMRAGAINQVRDLIGGAAVSTILTGVFSVVNLGLLFYYSSSLAFVAIGAVAVTVAVQVGVSISTIRVERQMQTIGGAIAGLLFQMIGGIAKLRVAGAEGRAFAVWAEKFRDQRILAYRAGTLQHAVLVFNDLVPALSTLALFAVAGSLASRPGGLNTGEFLAFNAAFGGFFGSTVALGNTIVSLLTIVPIMERARPILEATLETDSTKPDPGELPGHIEASHVSFRYAADGPLILKDVSVVARPGEFVALLGPSGSGKSTLLRILLGFETPESGAVYYDRQDLSVVDVSAVRAQIGVVLQSNRLLAGDIFTNIVGASPLTIDEAWAAAEQAGFADDIRQMPMGMHTVISEGGSTLSGGQRQRMLIARALVRKPRILFFDEATSALDNRTQETVSRSLEQMRATRIVIAHRLSTIRNADRLYVMDRGEVVQHGTYDELAAQPGLFQQLIARQLT